MKTIFFDVDSQLDFVFPSGALYVPGAERIVPAIARLNRFAAERGMTVISTTDAHSEHDPEFAMWPHHCVAGCWGQRKAESTLLPKRLVIPNGPCDIAIDGAQQIIVEKRTMDAFLAPNLGRVLDLLDAQRFVVYGVVTEICVLYAVRGLLKAGKQVTVVTDAIEALSPENGARALEEVRTAGGSLALLHHIVE